jgi:hypothetical protein
VRWQNLRKQLLFIPRTERKSSILYVLHHHDNVEAIQLLDNSELLRKLNRTKPFELANQYLLLEEHRHHGPLTRKHPNPTG